MNILIKLAYAAALAVLVVLFAVFGIRSVYSGPDQPAYSDIVTTPTRFPGPAPVPEDVQRAQEESRRFQEVQDAYGEERRDYRRNVLVIATVLGIAAVAAGSGLRPRFDAMRLGLMVGGFVILLYGVIQAAEDLGDMSPQFVFAVALAGLALVLAAGYRWMASQSES